MSSPDLQDNGTALKVGSFWHHVQDGDGGYCVINWADPRQVLVFSNGDIKRSTTGGKTHDGWRSGPPLGWQTMTQPIVGVPYNADPARKADARRVATGVAHRVLRVGRLWGDMACGFNAQLQA